MKTVSELNSHWWYRLLKVFNVITFITVALIVTTIISYPLIPYQTVDYNKSTFTCKEGNNKTFTLRSVNVFDTYVSPEKILDNCELPDTFNVTPQQVNTEPITWESLNERTRSVRDQQSRITESVSYNIEMKTIGSWFEVIGMVLLTSTLFVLGFEIFHRIFYYIILGSFFPKK